MPKRSPRTGWTMFRKLSTNEGVANRGHTAYHSAKECVAGMVHCHQYVNKFAFQLSEGNCEQDTQDKIGNLFRAIFGNIITCEALTA